MFDTDFELKTSSDHFFENATGRAITVNRTYYCDMIIQFFVPKLQNIDVDDMWFQQDGVQPDVRRTIQLLNHFLVV